MLRFFFPAVRAASAILCAQECEKKQEKIIHFSVPETPFFGGKKTSKISHFQGP